MAKAKKMAASMRKDMHIEAGGSDYHGMHLSLDDLCRYAGKEVFEAMLPKTLTARHILDFIGKADGDTLAELRRALMYERPVCPLMPSSIPTTPQSDDQP